MHLLHNSAHVSFSDSLGVTDTNPSSCFASLNRLTLANLSEFHNVSEIYNLFLYMPDQIHIYRT